MTNPNPKLTNAEIVALRPDTELELLIRVKRGEPNGADPNDPDWACEYTDSDNDLICVAFKDIIEARLAPQGKVRLAEPNEKAAAALRAAGFEVVELVKTRFDWNALCQNQQREILNRAARLKLLVEITTADGMKRSGLVDPGLGDSFQICGTWVGMSETLAENKRIVAVDLIESWGS